jgi:putative FmdB family regulatory protein
LLFPAYNPYNFIGIKRIMPIYEYKCQDCGHHVEVMQKVSDEPLKECERCGGKLEKQWSLSGFQFKGGGWYKTDYAPSKAPEVKVEPNEKMVATNLLKDEKKSAGESTPKASDASNKPEKKEK